MISLWGQEKKTRPERASNFSKNGTCPLKKATGGNRRGTSERQSCWDKKCLQPDTTTAERGDRRGKNQTPIGEKEGTALENSLKVQRNSSSQRNDRGRRGVRGGYAKSPAKVERKGWTARTGSAARRDEAAGGTGDRHNNNSGSKED